MTNAPASLESGIQALGEQEAGDLCLPCPNSWHLAPVLSQWSQVRLNAPCRGLSCQLFSCGFPPFPNTAGTFIMGSPLLFPLCSGHTPGLYKGTKCIGFALQSHPHYRLFIVRVHNEHKQKDSDFFSWTCFLECSQKGASNNGIDKTFKS